MWIFPALGGVSSATLWLSFFHIWCPGKCATCHLGYITRALHPSSWHQSLLAHAQSHGGPMLTTVLDYDDTFVSEEREQLWATDITLNQLADCCSVLVGGRLLLTSYSLQLWCSEKSFGQRYISTQIWGSMPIKGLFREFLPCLSFSESGLIDCCS